MTLGLLTYLPGTLPFFPHLTPKYPWHQALMLLAVGRPGDQQLTTGSVACDEKSGRGGSETLLSQWFTDFKSVFTSGFTFPVVVMQLVAFDAAAGP